MSLCCKIILLSLVNCGDKDTKKVKVDRKIVCWTTVTDDTSTSRTLAVEPVHAGAMMTPHRHIVIIIIARIFIVGFKNCDFVFVISRIFTVHSQESAHSGVSRLLFCYICWVKINALNDYVISLLTSCVVNVYMRMGRHDVTKQHISTILLQSYTNMACTQLTTMDRMTK